MIETVIVNTLIKQKNYSTLDQAKIRYGVRLVLSDFYKFLLVYSVALWLDCLLSTLIVHVTFYILRQVSFGFHFLSTISCIIWSIVAFPIMAAFLVAMPLPSWLVWGVGVFSVLTIFIKAPLGTAKHPIVNEQHRRYLRKKIQLRLLMVAVAICITPSYYQQFIVLGVFIQSVSLLIQSVKGGNTT